MANLLCLLFSKNVLCSQELYEMEKLTTILKCGKLQNNHKIPLGLLVNWLNAYSIIHSQCTLYNVHTVCSCDIDNNNNYATNKEKIWKKNS